ncbi:Slc25a29 [Symbiodinium sp. CCMP2592]|nr:Slc25a29 [Symbiodinium sp. CCMP2592]
MYLWVFPNRDYAVGAISGVVASCAAVGLSHPIEAVKVRMQTAQHLEPGAASTSLGRLAGLLQRPYYGVGPHLVQYMLLNSVRFGSYQAAQGYLQRRAGERPLWLSEIFGAGAFSGFCVAALLHPLFVVKTHQQVNRLSTPQAAKRLWQGEGPKGLFRTFFAGFARFPLALGVFFSSYEAMKRSSSLWPFDRLGSEVAAVQLRNSVYGAIAGVFCWTSVFPLDVVQSRVMGEAAYGADRKYTGVVACARELYRVEGLKAFVRGYSAVLMRAGPVNAVLFPAVDFLKPVVDKSLPS